MRHRCKTVAAVLLFAQCAVGCHSFQDPVYDARDKKIVVVPFRDTNVNAPKNLRWYGQSARGRRIVRYFEAWAEAEAAEHDIVRGEDAAQVVRNIENWAGDKIKPSDWRKILAGVDADLILLGEIVEFRHKRPNDLNILRGSARFDYRLVDARDGTSAYKTPASRGVRFPPERDTDIPFADLGERNALKVERGLQQEIAKRLGKELFGYYDDQH